MAQPAPAVVARRLLLTGRVQGVGFRPFVYRLAHELALDGLRAQPARRRRGRASPGRPRRSMRFARDLVERAPPLARPRVRGVTPCDAPVGPRLRHRAEQRGADSPQVSVPPDFFCLRRLPRGTGRSRRPPPPLSVHQLHAVRPALHADRGAAVRPAEHQHGALPAVRRRAGASTRIRSIAASTPSRSPARCAGRTSRSSCRGRDAGHGRRRGARRGRRRAARRARARRARHRRLSPAVRRAQRGRRAPPARAQAPPGQAARRDVSAARRGRARRACATSSSSSPSSTGRAARSGAPDRAGARRRRRPTSRRRWRRASREVGVFLPYSPLHHLLLAAFGGPVVATSGNVSGEPVLTDPAEAETRLARGRRRVPAPRPADRAAGRRLGRARHRGPRASDPARPRHRAARTRTAAPSCREPVLAVGGHLKLDGRARLGPAHRRLAAHRRHGHAAQRAGVRAGGARPAAPLRRARRGAGSAMRTRTTRPRAGCRRSGAAVHDGAAPPRACVGAGHRARRVDEPAIVFAWDGVGLRRRRHAVGRRDVRRPRRARGSGAPACGRSACRAATRPGRSPWRSAAALCWEAGVECPVADPRPDRARRLGAAAQRAAIERRGSRVRRRSRRSCSASARRASKGQGPMWLEACARDRCDVSRSCRSRRMRQGVLRIDWAPLLELAAAIDRRSTRRRAPARCTRRWPMRSVRVAEAERARTRRARSSA